MIEMFDKNETKYEWLEKKVDKIFFHLPFTNKEIGSIAICRSAMQTWIRRTDDDKVAQLSNDRHTTPQYHCTQISENL